MRMKRAKGWGIPDQIQIDRSNFDVQLCGVCTCARHKECAAEKRCLDLFARRGGAVNQANTLRRLMGKSYPRSFGDGWEMGYNHKRAERRKVLMEGFERKFFGRCRPIVVEVKTERGRV
jgi:hypothetical protein